MAEIDRKGQQLRGLVVHR